MASPFWRQLGLTAGDEFYIERAMDEIERRLANDITNNDNNVRYLVCSDDVDWTRRNVRSRRRLPVFYVDDFRSRDAPTGVDLAVLAGCDHVITTGGTFGWWGAFLASTSNGRRCCRTQPNGTIVTYYRGYPQPGSYYGIGYNHDDYYPPCWIGLD